MNTYIMNDDPRHPAGLDAKERCPCGRMDKPSALWLCRICYLEKEIRYALSELERGGDWPDTGLQRLRKLAQVPPGKRREEQ